MALSFKAMHKSFHEIDVILTQGRRSQEGAMSEYMGLLQNPSWI